MKFIAPATYKGIQGFHKYWGKKSSDFVAQLVYNFSPSEGMVFDPFLGYGSVARECARMNRHFIGYDINPVAIKIAKFAVSPPQAHLIREELERMKSKIFASIAETYMLEDRETIASHYFWDGDVMKEVWARNDRRSREVWTPTKHDVELAERYASYSTDKIRPMKFFHNSRINTKTDMSMSDIFTGRALLNMNAIITAIEEIKDKQVKTAMMLALTSASGQMSKMVFAITRRGKTSGASRHQKVEVGSWAIGYWRPKVHFEINVWDCFERRVKRIIKGCEEVEQNLFEKNGATPSISLHQKSCLDGLKRMQANSVDLIITDPPHGDRIPYLELSEMWNAILGEYPDFENEVVISNAKERGKTASTYFDSLSDVFLNCRRVLRPGGVCIIIFNSRKDAEWRTIESLVGRCSADGEDVYCAGHFSCAYSVRSLVQDNRRGALKSDLGIVFLKTRNRVPDKKYARVLQKLPEWSRGWPNLNRDVA